MFCPLVDALEDWLGTPATHHPTPYSALRDNKKKIKKGVQGPRVVLNGRSGGGSPNMALNYDKNTLNNNLNKTLSFSTPKVARIYGATHFSDSEQRLIQKIVFMEFCLKV